MIKSIEIENFKCFGERVRVPLAPITLIYGQNSGGKSSILQVLKLFKQTRDRAPRNIPLLLSLKDGGIVDVGSYSDLVHNHDVTKDVAIRVDFELNEHAWWAYWMERQSNDVPPYELEVPSGLSAEPPQDLSPAEIEGLLGDDVDESPEPPDDPPSDETDDVCGEEIDAMEESSRDSVSITWTFSFDPVRDIVLKRIVVEPSVAGAVDACSPSSDPLIVEIRGETAVASRFAGREAVTVGGDKLLIADLVRKHREIVLRGLRRAINVEVLNALPPRGNETRTIGEDGLESLPGYAERYAQIALNYRKAVAALEGDASDESIHTSQIAHERCRIDLNRFWFECRQATIPVLDWYALGQQPEAVYSCGSGGWTATRGPNVPARVSCAGCSVDELAQFIEEECLTEFDGLRPLAPLRETPKRFEKLTTCREQDVGYLGEHLASVLSNGEVLKEVNEEADRLGIPYEISLERGSGSFASAVSIRLHHIDRPGGDGDSLADVGFGIGQLLPIITQIVAAKNKLVILEQPELHIHPRLQAELGEALKRFPNRCIVETHSEHMVLRIQKLLRLGLMSVDDVNILYVCTSDGAANIKTLSLNRGGVFLDPWPDGFFPERLGEIMGDA